MNRKEIQETQEIISEQHDSKFGKKGLSTQCIHVGQNPDLVYGGVNVPIYTSTTFVQPKAGDPLGNWWYSRFNNPTRNALERVVSKIENGKYTCIFGSGMAAITAVINILDSGDEILSLDDLYGGTQSYFRSLSSSQNKIKYTFFDFLDLEKLKEKLSKNTKLVYLESSTNPNMKVVDLPSIVKIVKDFNQNIIIAIDNTFLSPYNFKPLDHGADIVIESATKYMNGHSDVLMGITCTNNESLYKRLYNVLTLVGGIPSPFDCYLVLRGLKTLSLRVERQNSNALEVAKFLEQNKNVKKVLYPGLKSSPYYEVSKKLHKGSGGVVSFILKGGLTESRIFLSRLNVFSCAVSLGSVESLAEHPALMTHSAVPPEVRRELGIDDGLIRLSIGVENIEDLIEDLRAALDF